MPPPPKGGGFALLTARWRKAPPSGELLSAAKRRGFTPRETPPVISLCSMPDSPFCRCATSSPEPGEVFPQRGSLWRNRKLCVDCQGLPLWGRWMRPAGADGEGEAVRLHHISFPFMNPLPAQIYRKFIQKPAKITLQV